MGEQECLPVSLCEAAVSAGACVPRTVGLLRPVYPAGRRTQDDIPDRSTQFPTPVAATARPIAASIEPTRAFQPESLASDDAAERDRAWSTFLATHSALLIRVARVVTHDHDAAMDAYAFMLDQLHDASFKRLASYTATDGCTFETWLAVVARRLCFDFYRHKYGRARGDDDKAIEAQQERRRLVDLVSVELDLELPTNNPAPDAALRQTEIFAALRAILGALSPKDRLLLRYRFDDALPAVQIMRVMRFPSVFHVYRRVNALLARCRSALQTQGFRPHDV